MASDIQITSFSAVPGVGIVALGAMAAPPAGFEDLSYMQPAKLRFFRNTSNNGATATQIGESTSGVLSYETTATYFYFAAAVDPAGNEGPRSAGIQCVPKTAAPGPNSVGTTELQNNAVTSAKVANAAITNAKIDNLAVDEAKIANLAVTDAKISGLSASKITAGTITASVSMSAPNINGGTITGSLIRTAASGKRVELSSSSNQLNVIDGSGNYRVSIGTVGVYSIVAASYASGATCIYAGATAGGAGAYGVRGLNSASGGGHGALGISAADGGFAVAAITGRINSPAGYSPFTGMHEMLVRKDAELGLGDIAYVVKIIARGGWDNVLAEVARAHEIADRRVIGVVSERKPLTATQWLPQIEDKPNESGLVSPVRRYLMDNFDLVTVNALGEGQMLVCGRGGDIEAGDYVCSSDLAGMGQRQNDASGAADDLLRRCTVAQTMEPVTFEHPDQIKRAAVFYRCG